ncbi:MAG: hypothetical protein ACK2UO_04155 [Caldilineaceae bacterium]
MTKAIELVDAVRTRQDANVGQGSGLAALADHARTSWMGGSQSEWSDFVTRLMDSPPARE